MDNFCCLGEFVFDIIEMYSKVGCIEVMLHERDTATDRRVKMNLTITTTEC